MIRALIVITFGLLTATSSAWAYRVIEQPEAAHELALGQVRLPAGQSGTVVFTACESCRTTAMRVTDQTIYFANGTQMELADLRDIAEDLLATTVGRDDTIVYIYYDVASLRVNRIAISYRS
ncbi:MAG: hypothetical protein HKN84_15560 [Gammaproteobacteria bacterium]|nr:hypothetical protein [Gammaproteobacteria bacterium]